MESGQANRFSAAAAALGYVAQLEYALLFALKRLTDTDNFRISLETADDIVFDSNGTATELWQTKHHVTQHSSLGNASVDLWKTIHNWIKADDDQLLCFLYTTSTAQSGSAAALLRANRGTDDILAARDILDDVAINAQNRSLSLYFKKYLSLNEDQRLTFLSRITIIDGGISSASLTESLVASVRLLARPNRLVPLVERIRGWWYSRITTHLKLVATGTSDWIELIRTGFYGGSIL